MRQPSGPIDQDVIIHDIENTFTGVEVVRPTDGPGAGDTFFFYDPERTIDPTHRLPFATIVTKDYGDFDNASRLDRPDIFRLNIGVSRSTFQARFGQPARTQDTSYDFAALDRLMPHPVYAPQWWVCVLNPSPDTFEAVKPLLADAYAKVAPRQQTMSG